MRCLALAQTAKDYGIQTFFVMNTCSKIIKKRIESQGFELRPRMSEEKHVIIDGYQFDTHVQQTMKAQGRRVLFIDDFGHCDRYVSDLVLNQNIYAAQSFYPDLGPRYVLLRREFLQKKPAPKQHEKRNVLISVGGFDQQDMLNRLEKTFKKMGYDVRAAKNTIDMPALMQWADIAVTAAGTTAYELAYMNVPMIMIVMADNQQRVAEGMADAGYGINLGWHENVTDKMIHAAMKKSIFSPRKSIIDGYGADRVLSNLFKWPIWLRPIIKEDCELLFRWANDPVIRAMSLSPETIAWDRHQAWFNKKMNDRSCRIFIAIDTVKDHPIGQIRSKDARFGNGHTLDYTRNKTYIGNRNNQDNKCQDKKRK
jgi:UDP-2,4-diacetamido-2,4,6-trideoxy-beta-L-altropyranose hydrolase